MEKPSAGQQSEIVVTYDSLLPYDEIAAYQFLIAKGLKNIRSPKLVDDSIGDSPPEWKEVLPLKTNSSLDI